MADDVISFPFAFPLSRPIQAHGDDLRELTIQEPTGDHVLEFGLLDRGLTGDVVPRLLEKLANVPESAIRKMAGADLIKLTTKLSRFFSEAAR